MQTTFDNYYEEILAAKEDSPKAQKSSKPKVNPSMLELANERENVEKDVIKRDAAIFRGKKVWSRRAGGPVMNDKDSDEGRAAVQRHLEHNQSLAHSKYNRSEVVMLSMTEVKEVNDKFIVIRDSEVEATDTMEEDDADTVHIGYTKDSDESGETDSHRRRKIRGGNYRIRSIQCFLQLVTGCDSKKVSLFKS